ncbi:hypothetical protein CPB84DRAFT_1842619 [Gymnopilus junonius]|uniref:Uncharacterized protein n=1 Tax=Gymnopilus junonius TaxID=109634 RepID=A0A9P5NYA2_GYMJU|nr:hypothetical protein CPB84DRAFT_1842619 [Gymnopilus junonius]
MTEQRQSSPSRSRRPSLSSKISSFGTKLSRTLTGSSDGYSAADNITAGDETDSVSPIISRPKPESSPSREREVFHSTGRGGAGNIRQTNIGSGSSGINLEDFSIIRGREPFPHSTQNQVFSTGRGGAGNLRSLSRDPESIARAEAVEQEVIKEYLASQEGAIHSSGRGGLGNLNRSRSRDPSAPPAYVYSTGRGGAGNIAHFEGAHHAPENLDEKEQWKPIRPPNALHSTGRGGVANITSRQEPPIEPLTHVSSTPHEFQSTGRGGLDNLVGSQTSSRHWP